MEQEPFLVLMLAALQWQDLKTEGEEGFSISGNTRGMLPEEHICVCMHVCICISMWYIYPIAWRLEIKQTASNCVCEELSSWCLQGCFLSRFFSSSSKWQLQHCISTLPSMNVHTLIFLWKHSSAWYKVHLHDFINLIAFVNILSPKNVTAMNWIEYFKMYRLKSKGWHYICIYLEM